MLRVFSIIAAMALALSAASAKTISINGVSSNDNLSGVIAPIGEGERATLDWSFNTSRADHFVNELRAVVSVYGLDGSYFGDVRRRYTFNPSRSGSGSFDFFTYFNSGSYRVRYNLYTFGTLGGVSYGIPDYTDTTLTVNNSAPLIQALFSDLKEAGQSSTLSVRARDFGYDTYTISWDIDGDGNYDDYSGSNINHTFSTAGLQTIGIKATDSEGASSFRSFSVDILPAVPLPAGAWMLIGGCAMLGALRRRKSKAGAN